MLKLGGSVTETSSPGSQLTQDGDIYHMRSLRNAPPLSQQLQQERQENQDQPPPPPKTISPPAHQQLVPLPISSEQVKLYQSLYRNKHKK